MNNDYFKILAIDDFPDNLTSIKALITEAFPMAEVFLAGDGKKGIELANTILPDIILLDVIMPVIDGYEVCSMIKGNSRLSDIPVVFLTALKGESENRIKALEVGADAFLAKPIDEVELIAQLRAMIKIRNSNLKNRDEKAWLEMLVNSRTRALEDELKERKKAEKKIRISEEKFRYVFEAANVGKSITLLNGEMDVNQAFCDMLGYQKEELQHKTWMDLTPYNEIPVINQKLEPLVKGEIKSVRFNKSYIHKNGTPIWCDISVVMHRDENGVPLNFITTVIDITERVKAIEALREREALMKSIFTASPVGIGLVANRIIIEANEFLSNITGYSREELFGQDSRILYPNDETYEYVGNEKYRQIERLGVGTVETQFVRKNGEFIDVLISSAPINPDDLSVGVTFTVLDITEKKKSERKILMASENWNTTFRAIKSGILLIDDKQRIIQSNEAFQDFVGKTTTELYQNCCYTFVHGAECAIDDCPFTRMKKSKKRETLELILQGTHFEVIVDPIVNENDQITGAVHILNDITQRKLDEKIQHILFEIARTSVSNNTLEDLLVVVRKELNKVMDTTNFFVAFYQPETDTLRNVIFEDEMDDFSEWEAGNSLSGQVIKLGKTLLLNKEEVIKFAELNNLTLIGSPSECWLGAPLTVNQQVIGTIVIQSYKKGTIYTQNNARLLEMIANELSLVIERNQMIDDLLKAKEKAEESDKLKSAFLANMSHEIRTPMNGILGFTSLLSESDLTGEGKDKYIDIIQKSGQRMLNTVNDLIDISKIETGQMPLVYTETNLREQMQNLYAFFIAEAKNKGLSMVFRDNILPEMAVIETDVAKLDSIMTNLIKNAIKYTDRGSVEVCGVVKNQWFEFYVRDTGIGIPQHRQKAVFNRFEQADISDTRAYQGSGLGLTIARAYAEMLGGTMDLESEAGIGSVFSVKIPVRNRTNKQKMPEAPSNKSVEFDNQKIKILIAEDDPIGLEYMKTILTEINCEITSASNGKEVVALFEKNQDVDIILMDIRMPVMDGYQATQLIREINRNVYIIAQTAFALAGDREKALEAGCSEYLTKPVNRKQLIQLIKNYTYNES